MADPHRYLPLQAEPASENLVESLDLTILPNTRQVQGIFTILRDDKASRQDFVFFTDRLATLLVEHALQHLPYTPRVITTPVEVECTGKQMDVKVIHSNTHPKNPDPPIIVSFCAASKLCVRESLRLVIKPEGVPI